jgi:hypothetical protein
MAPSLTITFLLTEGEGIRYLSDLSKLASSPDLRETLRTILHDSFNKRYPKCPPYIFALVSIPLGCFLLAVSIILARFVGKVGTYTIPIGILCILSSLIYSFIHDVIRSRLFGETIKKVHMSTDGIHDISCKFSGDLQIHVITLKTNAERLKRLKGVDVPVPKKKAAAKKKTPTKKKNGKSPVKKKKGKIKKKMKDPSKKKQNQTESDKKPLPPLPQPIQFNSTYQHHKNMNPNPNNQQFGQKRPFAYPNSEAIPFGAFNNPIHPGGLHNYDPFPPHHGIPYRGNVNMHQGQFGQGEHIIQNQDIAKLNQIKMDDVYQVPMEVIDEHYEKKK